MAYNYASTITDILNTWANMGIFAYVLPFLMIFAVVYGILNKSRILGDNKGVQATVSLAAGLLALQFDYVPNFFASIFPYFGMGLSVLLVALILMGLLNTDEKSKARWIWFGIGTVIFIVVLLTTLSDTAWIGGFGYGWADTWPAILALIVIGGFMALIIWGGEKRNPTG